MLRALSHGLAPACCATLFLSVAAASYAQEPAPSGHMSSAVQTLVRESTAAYQQMRSYQHTEEYLVKSGQRILEDHAYSLALERPNRFAFRSDSKDDTAAVSDGQTYVNFDASNKTYTRDRAPATFKQIDLVNGVTFQPIATYIIALMLQGDPTADPDVRAALDSAGAPSTAMDAGVKYDIITLALGPNHSAATFYFDVKTHLLHKATSVDSSNNSTLAEIIENVKIDKPVPATIFQYTPPQDAHWIL